MLELTVRGEKKTLKSTVKVNKKRFEKVDLVAACFFF